MEEKEMKKLDEKGEEKVSGGLIIDGVKVDEDKAKEILVKKGIAPEKVDECNQKPKELPKLSDRPFVNMEYGAPIISIKKLMDEDLKLIDEELK